jgi:ZIP family zinc transporter
MLPSSKTYLLKSELSDSNAAWILMGCFGGGFVGIQLVSNVIHRFMPSHVVDCDHDHKETPHSTKHTSRRLSHAEPHSHRQSGRTPDVEQWVSTESTPLIASQNGECSKVPGVIPKGRLQLGIDGVRSVTPSDITRKSSIIDVSSRVMSFIKDQKANCDEGGPCYGYSEPCGQECFKHPGIRTPASRTPNLTRQSTFQRLSRHFAANPHKPLVSTPISPDLEDVSTTAVASSRSNTHEYDTIHSGSEVDSTSQSEDLEAQHHHHVPQNAFMSIGIQTSIAIAIHKLPEGFITYATNHANPTLGFSVFMALFFHNVTEGYALALPVYLSLNSRWKAMGVALVLGGLTQPAGAGVAALWFKFEGYKPGTTMYGCMFGVTAGVMASVALQLFAEGLAKVHNRALCIVFAFLGMAIMGVSNALTS